MIYEVNNKNHLKNINDQNFVHFMRGLRQRGLRQRLLRYIHPNNAEELENLTDPNLHNTPIYKLELEFRSFNFSSKTIENLKVIYPNSITLEDDSVEKDESTNQALFENFTKLLSKLDRTSLEMSFQKNYNKIKIEFRDVIFKVVESKSE